MLSFTRFSVLAIFLVVATSSGSGCAESKPSMTVHGNHRAAKSDLQNRGVLLASHQASQNPDGPVQSNSAPPDRLESNRGEKNLASEMDGQPQNANSNGEEFLEPPSDLSETDDGNQAKTDDAPAPSKRKPYTAPSFSVRNLTLASATANTTFGMTQIPAGREAAEAGLISSSSITGQAGLTAPQPTVRGTVLGRAGSRDNRLALFSSASPNTIFTAVANPRSGANGICGELAGAGFAGHAVCIRGSKHH